LTLTVERTVAGTWQELQAASVPMPDWRMDGWHGLVVRSTPAGITARFGDVEPTVARAQLGDATGVFGLYAGTRGSATARVAVRAFRTVP
jgi:hypothetical protein